MIILVPDVKDYLKDGINFFPLSFIVKENVAQDIRTVRCYKMFDRRQ